MTTIYDSQPMTAILEDIKAERGRQRDKWGIQHRREIDPTMPSADYATKMMNLCRAMCDRQEQQGKLDPESIKPYTGGATWMNILLEEFWEAVAEPDKAKRRKELVQAAAVIAAWIEDLDTH